MKKDVCSYRLWAKLLQHRRSPYPRDGHFNFEDMVNNYVWSIRMGDIVDAEPPEGAIMIDNKAFVFLYVIIFVLLFKIFLTTNLLILCIFVIAESLIISLVSPAFYFHGLFLLR